MGIQGDTSRTLFIDPTIAFTSGQRIGLAYAPEILKYGLRGDLFLVSDALAVQEVADIQPPTLHGLFRAALRNVVTVEPADLSAARVLRQGRPQVSPRVLLHAAVMRRIGYNLVCALSGVGYETFADIEVIAPKEVVALWREQQQDDVPV